MRQFFFIEICIYILEIVLSVYFSKVYFMPLFGYLYVVMVSRQIEKPKERLLFCCLSGLFYDLLVTTTPFMHTFLFPFLVVFITKLDAYFLKNKFTSFLLVLLEIFLYRTVVSFILVVIQYQPFFLTSYLHSVLYSLLCNLLFVFLYSFFFLRKDKMHHHKRRGKRIR